MASISFKVNVDSRKLRELMSKPRQVDSIVRAIAFDGQADVQRSFGTSPSAAGSPPGIDTGALKNSIHVQKTDDMAYAIRTGVDYDVFLEFGTSRMSARPFMGPMAYRLENRIPSHFKNWID